MKIRTLSATIAMLLAPAVLAEPAELFISEYVEGSGNNKALELYNPGDAAIDLAGYALKVYFNGSTNVGTTINLQGSVPAGGTFVYASSSAVPELVALANQTSGASLWNGDDAITLTKDGAVIDSFGQLGFDPGSAWGEGDLATANRTLRRTAAFYDLDTGDVFDPSVQWLGFAQDDFSDLGQFNGSGDGGGDNGGGPVDPDPVLVCGAQATAISAIQGTGSSSPLAGQVVQVEAVVSQTLPGMKGYMLQAVGAEQDDNALTSEGLFVYVNSSELNVSAGQRVRVQGSVSEYYNQTQLSNLSAVLDCGSSVLPEPVVLSLPLTSADALEAYEGMLVQFTQPLTVNDTSSLGRYGELTLANGRRYTPTQVVAPGAEARALEAQHKLNRIILDDANTTQYPAQVPFPVGNLSAFNSVRAGDSVINLSGVLYYGFNEYRVMPAGPVNIVHSNPRTDAPELAPGGNVKVASFNVLNYFNGDGAGAGFPTSRGADTAVEFERQRAKIIAAIIALDAAVVGVMEIENDGYGDTSAINDLVSGLRLASGNDNWQFVDAGAPVGTDEIAVGLLYRADLVQPSAPLQILSSANSALDEQGAALFDDRRNRPMLAQRFTALETGADFAVMVNHLKSKGSGCGAADADTGDGQGDCNLTRTRAAQAIAQFAQQQFADLPAVILGDMNAYAKEDPITTLSAAGYLNVFEALGKASHSYIFSGLSGSLDHALLNDMALQHLVDATKWHINADEPEVLDYNTERKSVQQQADYFAPDAYRSSDHDPVVVSLNLPQAVPPLDVSLQLERVMRNRIGLSLVQLSWSGDVKGTVLYRDDKPVFSLRLHGRYTDLFWSRAAEVSYKVCQWNDATRCSEPLKVSFN